MSLPVHRKKKKKRSVKGRKIEREPKENKIHSGKELKKNLVLMMVALEVMEVMEVMEIFLQAQLPKLLALILKLLPYRAQHL